MKTEMINFDLRVFRKNTSKDTLNNKVKIESNILSPMKGIAIFSAVAIVGASIGATIGTYIFFGTTTPIGLIAVIESNKYLKIAATKSNIFIDIGILGASIYAMSVLGPTVAASITFAGLGYSLVYAPYLRNNSQLM